MGLECWCRCVFGGTGRIFKTIVMTSLIVALSISTSRAGDISSQPADSLSITNSVTRLLPQATPPSGGEMPWLKRLHISGFATQTFGMWQNPTALRAYTPSRNNLAVARSLLQIDGNFRLNESNTFFARGWFVYEPPYSYNSANASVIPVTSPLASRQPYINPSRGSFGHYLNSEYNTYDLRDAWWENKTGPLTIYVGNQIVVWGQSLAFRVGDVINPTNTCWAFGFANLEQSRIPQWMFHPFLGLPEAGPFTSNFLELVVQPGFQPNWQPNYYQDPYRKYKSALTAGRGTPCYPAMSHGPSGRFDVQYPTEPIWGADAVFKPGIGPFTVGGGQATELDANGKPIFQFMGTNPTSRRLFICTPEAIKPGWNPYAAYLKHFHPKCNLHLNKHNNSISPIGNGSGTDFGMFHLPGMQPENWNEGVRFHTLYGETEWTAFFYNDNTNNGSVAASQWTFGTNLFKYDYPDVQDIGVTFDRPMPMPATLTDFFPAVIRGEVLYQNHEWFTTMQFEDMEGRRFSDQVRYMLALDLDQAYAPWLTSTGNLNANLEFFDNIIMDTCQLCYNASAFDGHQLKNDVQVLFNIGTSWWWNDFGPTFTMIYNPKGTTFTMFPAITLNPPWTKKYFMRLQAIEILGGDKVWGTGRFKGQSYLLAQFQYNFNLM